MPDLKNVLTVISYYKNNCGPAYRNVVEQMLPTNLYAYNALAWDFTNCAIVSGNRLLGMEMINEIVLNNPGNVQVQHRANFYIANMSLMDNFNLSTQPLSFEARLNSTALNLLVSVANSSSDFAPAACYQLHVLAPDLSNGNCVGNPTGRLGKQEETPFTQSSKTVIFNNIPNPFSESTRVVYMVSEDVQHAVLKIFDMQGKLVKSLELDKNANEITVYADDLKRGMYIYLIEADGYPSMQKGKMTIIK